MEIYEVIHRRQLVEVLVPKHLSEKYLTFRILHGGSQFSFYIIFTYLQRVQSKVDSIHLFNVYSFRIILLLLLYYNSVQSDVTVEHQPT